MYDVCAKGLCFRLVSGLDGNFEKQFHFRYCQMCFCLCGLMKSLGKGKQWYASCVLAYVRNFDLFCNKNLKI